MKAEPCTAQSLKGLAEARTPRVIGSDAGEFLEVERGISDGAGEAGGTEGCQRQEAEAYTLALAVPATRCCVEVLGGRYRGMHGSVVSVMFDG